MSIKVLLVSKVDSHLSVLRQQLQDEEIAILGESDGGTDTLELVENLDPEMVVFSMAEDDQDTLNLAERILTYRPRCFVVLVTEQLSMQAMRSAMAIGAHNVTALTEEPKDLVDYVKGVYHNESLRLRAMSNHQDVAWSSQVFTVFSAKGGQGKTTMAVNLAAALADKGKKVAIVDLDLQFGDVPTYMDIEPRETMVELLQDNYTLTIDTIRSYMVMHSSGVHVLCAPKSPEYSEMISAKRIQNLLSTMRSYYDFVILDTASVFNDVTLTAIEASNKVFLLTAMDLASLKNARLAMNLFESLQQKEKVAVIINRYDDSSSIKLEDVEQVLHETVTTMLPTDQSAALNALNKGLPFVTSAPSSKLSAAVLELVDGILSGDPEEMKKGRMNKGKKRLFRRK